MVLAATDRDRTPKSPFRRFVAARCRNYLSSCSEPTHFTARFRPVLANRCINVDSETITMSSPPSVRARPAAPRIMPSPTSSRVPTSSRSRAMRLVGCSSIVLNRFCAKNGIVPKSISPVTRRTGVASATESEICGSILATLAMKCQGVGISRGMTTVASNVISGNSNPIIGKSVRSINFTWAETTSSRAVTVT